MKETRILGIIIKDRIKEAGKTQITLSKYASLINSRFGLHELTEETCSRKGLIILHLGGNRNLWDEFENEIRKIEGIQVHKMSFD